MPNSLRVVFDVNVFIDALVGRRSTFPVIEEIPPASGNWAADCISLAFDGADFQLYCSPHIINNMARVFRAHMGLSDNFVAISVEAVSDIVHQSGGSILEPKRHTTESKDFEDNLILDLVIAVNADVLVTNDQGLLNMTPWHGRLIMHPQEFVERVVRARTRKSI
jgi:predicted nucleic acid-binding protein